MEQIETRSTSKDTAECNPISLRATDSIRLVFLPVVVNNPTQPEASVRGEFVYQRKGKKDEWIPIRDKTLASLKKGEGFRLELHSGELLRLVTELRMLYGLHREQGVPRGRARFVRLEAGLAGFLALGQEDLRAFLDTHPEHAASSLLKLVRWIATSPNASGEVARLSSIAPNELPAVGALLGLSAMKNSLRYWEENRSNPSEDFWHEALSQRVYVLSQILAYPIVVVGEKAYVGGKTIANQRGNLVDFLAKIESTNGVVLIEIKTPTTKLLGQEYRNGVFPFSHELSGAITQVISYRQSLMTNFHALLRNGPKLTLGDPRCVVIAGDAGKDLTTQEKQESFELLRDRVQGVTVLTYDELFKRLRTLIDVLESS